MGQDTNNFLEILNKILVIKKCKNMNIFFLMINNQYNLKLGDKSLEILK